MSRFPCVSVLSLAVLLLLSLSLVGCGSATKTAQATPAPAPGPQQQSSTIPVSVTASASPATVARGQFTTISWSAPNATSVTISPDPRDSEETGPLAPSGTLFTVPASTTTYVLTATTASGATASQPVTVAVSAATVDFNAGPPSIAPGTSTTLQWNAQNIRSFQIDGVGTFDSPTGSVTVSPSATTTYTATATDIAGVQTHHSAIVTVSSAVTASNPIRHIIVMLQENRSFDDYFGVLGAYRASRVPGASPGDVDGFNPDVTLTTSTGVQVKPYHQRTVCTENLSPAWNEAHYDAHLKYPATYMNLGSSPVFLMDRFALTTKAVTQTYDPNGTRPMGYYNEQDLPFYYEAATQFATSDRFFSPILSNTIPNRMYMFTGTSFGHIKQDPSGHAPYTQKTIFKALNDAGVSWRMYYQDTSVFLAEFQDWSDPKVQGKVYPISNWYNVLSQPNADQYLPEVIFIERAGKTGLDEHPTNNIQKGSADVQKIVNALLSSTAWQHSVFILAFDEFGGFYDHVPPQPAVIPDNIPPNLTTGSTQAQFNLTGYRVPIVVMSPWVKPHYVSHTVRDTTSILRFIETQFGVPSLTARDAAQTDFSDFFDFSSPHWLTPPALPTQPTNGTCNPTLEAAY